MKNTIAMSRSIASPLDFFRIEEEFDNEVFSDAHVFIFQFVVVRKLVCVAVFFEPREAFCDIRA